jgi:hypothetical protein
LLSSLNKPLRLSVHTPITSPSVINHRNNNSPRSHPTDSKKFCLAHPTDALCSGTSVLKGDCLWVTDLSFHSTFETISFHHQFLQQIVKRKPARARQDNSYFALQTKLILLKTLKTYKYTDRQAGLLQTTPVRLSNAYTFKDSIQNLPVLFTFLYPENFRPTIRTRPTHSWTSIFHGDRCCIFDIPLSSTLNTICLLRNFSTS